MLITNKDGYSSQDFYVCDLGDGVIGFDGMGAIDFDHSDLQKQIVEIGPTIPTRYEARITDGPDPRRIAMRRAVRMFDLYYDYRFNVLMVAPDVRRDFEVCIDQSVCSLESVVCSFGKKSASYSFGRLKNYSCESYCIWERSCFAMVDSSRFMINQTRIGRGEVPLDSEVSYDARGLKFPDYSRFRTGAPVLNRLVPERLAFSFPQQDILNFGIGMTLISQRLFESLWSRPRPKSRVLGLTGSRPLVRVDFGVIGGEKHSTV